MDGLETDIKKFSDYRKFLQAFVDGKKEKKRSWSLNVWSRQLKLASPSSLSMILNGERHPSFKLVNAFCDYFQFSPKDEEYFRGLVDIQKNVKRSALSVQLTRQLQQETSTAQLSYYLLPLTLIIKEMISLKMFKIDAEWLNSHLLLDVTLDELNYCLNFLQENGILYRDEDESWSIHDGKIIELLSHPEEIRQFHHQLAFMTKLSYDFSPPELRTYHSSFLRVKEENIPQANKIIKEFQKELTSLVDDDDGDTILQCNLQAFPVTKK